MSLANRHLAMSISIPSITRLPSALFRVTHPSFTPLPLFQMAAAQSPLAKMGLCVSGLVSMSINTYE